MSMDPNFPAAAYDRWKTASPEVDAKECLRCGCVEGAEKQECDIAAYKCACHWSEEDRAAITADEELATRKEEI